MKRYYLIDHKHLFLFGFIFYLFVPYIVGSGNMFKGYPGMDLFQGFFDRIPGAQLRDYMLISLSWLVAFFLGHFCFKLIVPAKTNLILFPVTQTTMGIKYIGIFLFLVLLAFSWVARHSLFGGYSSYDIGSRGKLSTLLVIFNFFFVYQLISRQQVSALIVAGTLINALLLITMGGRMYVMQTFLVYLIFRTSFSEKRWKLIPVLLFAVTGFLIASLMGVWRLGASFNPTRAVYSFLAEPTFTWFSTSTFLIANDIPFFNIPLNFLSSFLNLVPNTIISLKAYTISTQAMGFDYQNPLGADSLWTTLVINFGAVGSFFFIFLCGFLLNLLKYLSGRSRFWAVYYIMVCSILPFQLFRDGFYIINKQLFFNFLLFPVLLLMLLKTVIFIASYAVRKQPEATVVSHTVL